MNSIRLDTSQIMSKVRIVSCGLLVALGGLPGLSNSQDKIDLESTFIGDREQPSVSYFIPWKAPEGPDKLYRPIKSISGNVLDPVDKDILARNIQFYNELFLEQENTNH